MARTFTVVVSNALIFPPNTTFFIRLSMQWSTSDSKGLFYISQFSVARWILVLGRLLPCVRFKHRFITHSTHLYYPFIIRARVCRSRLSVGLLRSHRRVPRDIDCTRRCPTVPLYSQPTSEGWPCKALLDSCLKHGGTVWRVRLETLFFDKISFRAP
jgi:hypothetical protein